MIRGCLVLLVLLILSACSNFELVLKDTDKINPYKDKTSILFDENVSSDVAFEFISLIGNEKKGEYILKISFSEEKENIIVKKNQVAEKIDYELLIKYKVFKKNSDCEIVRKNITTRFSFVPKSFGYNFGTERSFKKLYRSSVRKNINEFLTISPTKTALKCIK
jgi:hypothetical protein